MEQSENMGLKLNASKSFTMVFSNNTVPPKCKIQAQGKELKQVESIICLGSRFTQDGRSTNNIKQHIGIAKMGYTNLSSILNSRNINMKICLRVLEGYIWSTFLYGSETCNINQRMKQQLESTEKWFLRHMLKIPYTAHQTNEDVLKLAGTKRKLITKLRNRQLKFVGHILRKGKLEKSSVTGMIGSRRARERQRKSYIGTLSS